MNCRLQYVKTYIDVVVKMRTDGTYIPIKVIWDGREFEIDTVTRISQSQPPHVGGNVAIRYSVKMAGKEKDLFLEDRPRRWFIEKPVIQYI